ncbi:MAG: tetratricopeptide repeat protein [Kiritimatiellae bacterium]|nr:tetratricopeptide repeat protein [Kiritimatiellia bacterium]
MAENPAENPNTEADAEKPVPQNIRNLHIKAQSSLERNPDLAIDMMLRCVQACPWFIQARTDLRKAEIARYLRKHGGKAASSPFSAITASLQSMKIQGLLKKEKTADALMECEKMLMDDPLNVRLVKLYAETAIRAGRYPAGLMTMELAREHIPAGDTDALAMLGKLYFQTKDYQKARECFERVHRAKPADAEIAKLLKNAEALATSGQWETAAKAGDYRKALKDEKEVEKLDAQNKSVKTAKDADALIQETLRKIEKEPKNVNYYLALVNLYIQQKRYQPALEAIDRARSIVGQDPALDLRYADVRTEQLDTEVAALREAGDEAGAAAKQAERDQYVFDDIAERVQRYPNDQHLRFQLGEQYWKYGYPDEAIQQFQISQRSPKDRVMSLYLMAQCFRQKGMLDMSVEQLNGALEQLPTMDRQKMDVYYLLGEIHEEEGKLDEASKYFKEIYRADVTYKDVSDRVQRIYEAQKAQKQ